MTMIDKKMKISNFDINKLNILELGCGRTRKFQDSITIDIVDLDTIDVVADLNKGLSFIPDNSIDKIYSFHFLEHVDNIEFLMYEIYRVLKPGGKKIGTVPHFSNPHYYSDYTHKKFFGLYTFSYFSKSSPFKRDVPKFYNSLDFKIIEIKLIFGSYTRYRSYLKRIFQFLVNFNVSFQEFYEENLSYLIPASEIYFVLEKTA